MNQRGLRTAVVGVDLFEAASAIVGAVGLLVGFINIPVSVLKGTPFSDFTVPALLLGAIVGGSALVAAPITALARPPWDYLASLGAGLVTIGWFAGEFTLIGFGSWAQAVWFTVGLLMVGLSALLWRAESEAAGGRHVTA